MLRKVPGVADALFTGVRLHAAQHFPLTAVSLASAQFGGAIMDTVLRPWRHYADFAGRSRRTEFLLFILLFYVALFAWIIVGACC